MACFKGELNVESTNSNETSGILIWISLISSTISDTGLNLYFFPSIFG